MLNNTTEARSFFKQIKQRIVSNDYASYFDDEAYYINNRRLTRAEIDLICEKVREILASDVSINDALFRIIPDNYEYEQMDESAKNRYILELSKIYSKIKFKITQ